MGSRHLLVLLTIGALVATACGASPAAPTSTTTAAAPASPPTAPGSTTRATEATSTTVTTLAAPTAASPLDAVLDDISILTLAVEEGEMGRFRVSPAQTDYIPLVDGRYWVTQAGNVYTVLDLDEVLISSQMDRLADDVAAQATDEAGAYVMSLRDDRRSVEMQLGIVDAARWVGIWPPRLEIMEQFVGFSGRPLPGEGLQCLEAIEATDIATRTLVRNLEIELAAGPDQGMYWDYPGPTIDAALEADELSSDACRALLDADAPRPDLRFAVTQAGEVTTIEVAADRKIYADRGYEPEFTVTVRPDPSVGLPPAAPEPVPLLSLRGSYLASIGVCGELPWIYSNFAAANSYYEPGSDFYFGPTIYDSDWLCEDQVPADRR